MLAGGDVMGGPMGLFLVQVSTHRSHRNWWLIIYILDQMLSDVYCTVEMAPDVITSTSMLQYCDL